MPVHPVREEGISHVLHLAAVRPAAATLIDAKVPQVPIAYRLDNSQLKVAFPDFRVTPLREGMWKILVSFDSLKVERRCRK